MELETATFWLGRHLHMSHSPPLSHDSWQVSRPNNPWFYRWTRSSRGFTRFLGGSGWGHSDIIGWPADRGQFGHQTVQIIISLQWWVFIPPNGPRRILIQRCIAYEFQAVDCRCHWCHRSLSLSVITLASPERWIFKARKKKIISCSASRVGWFFVVCEASTCPQIWSTFPAALILGAWGLWGALALRASIHFDWRALQLVPQGIGEGNNFSHEGVILRRFFWNLVTVITIFSI